MPQRLILPFRKPKTLEHVSRSLEVIENWANQFTVNKIIAGTGVTVTQKAQAQGKGNSGTGDVTINVGSTGGVSNPAVLPTTGSAYNIAVGGSGIWVLGGTGIELPGSSIQYPILVTKNAGLSWLGVPVAGVIPSTIKYVACSGSTILAIDGLTTSVYYSTDSGSTWNSSTIAASVGNAVCIIGSTGIWVVSDGYHVFTSTNNGTSWTTVGTISTTNNPVAIGQSGTIIVVVGDAVSNATLYSTDSGSTWSQGVAGTGGGGADPTVCIFSSSQWYILLKIPAIYQTNNAGASYTLVDSPSISSLNMNGVQTRLVAGINGPTPQAAYASIPYHGFTTLSPSLPFSSFYSCAIDDSLGKWLFGGTAIGTASSPLTVFNAQ